MVYITLSFHLCYRYPRDEVEWCRNWRVVEKWTVLGYWWCFSPSLCRLPRVAESTCWNWHQLHCYIQGIRWRRRLYWTVHVQVDNPSHPTNYSPHHKLGRCRCRDLLRHQQWLPIMGSAIWQALLCLLGDRPSVSLPQRFDGSPEPNTHHCRRLVDSPRFHFLFVMGAGRSVYHNSYWTRCTVVWNQLLEGKERLLEDWKFVLNYSPCPTKVWEVGELCHCLIFLL